MRKMKRNHWLIPIVILSLFVSIAWPALAADNTIRDTMSDIAGQFSKSNAVQGMVPPLEQQEIKMDISIPESVYATGDKLLEIKNVSAENRKHRLIKKDRFNYQQKDVEELVLAGVPMEDIYMSDQLGNQWNVNPRELLKRKQEGQMDWAQVASELSADTINKLQKKLKQNPALAKKFAKMNISPAEQLEIADKMDTQKANFEDILSDFAKQGLLEKDDLNMLESDGVTSDSIEESAADTTSSNSIDGIEESNTLKNGEGDQ
ncbi:hypothetical protein [Cohnella sp. GCM10012308]|uniref:hypothetical protein n=1 Tax=Cohnella sp. GCM10012308 TaxID=3317329 RepID=UPI0036230060